MWWLKRLCNRIMAWRTKPGPRPEDIPRLLDAVTLEQAMREARFLHRSHAVDVRSVEPGELPIPKRADVP
jgi:hypothetical protein